MSCHPRSKELAILAKMQRWNISSLLDGYHTIDLNRRQLISMYHTRRFIYTADQPASNFQPLSLLRRSFFSYFFQCQFDEERGLRVLGSRHPRPSFGRPPRLPIFEGLLLTWRRCDKDDNNSDNNSQAVAGTGSLLERQKPRSKRERQEIFVNEWIRAVYLALFVDWEEVTKTRESGGEEALGQGPGRPVPPNAEGHGPEG